MLSVEDVVEVNRLEEDGEKEVVDVAPAAVIGTSRPSKNTTTAASRRSSTSDTEESNSGESDDDYKDKAETTRADGSWGGGSCGSSCSGGVKGKGAVKGKNFKQEVILSKSKEDSMSSKIQALLDDLGFVRQSCLDNNSPQEKSVIFSQWTQVLDLIEVTCR